MAKYGRFKYGQAKYGTDSPLWVTSRKKSDLENNTDYAYINYTDLNRIETRIEELSSIMNERGITNRVTTNTWSKQTSANLSQNLPVSSRVDLILQNINKLLALISELEISAELPHSMKYLDIFSANAIEQSIFEAYTYVKNLT